jgi:hypothetical protein
MVAWWRERGAGNGGGKAMGMRNAAAAAVRRRSAWSGRLPDSEADDWAHAVLYFFQIIQTSSNLILENGCLTVLCKLPIFACG